MTLWTFWALSIIVLTGCTSNIQHIPTTITQIEKSRIFNTSFEKAWTATLHVLSQDETFKVLDKPEGIIVTEFRTVDSKELSFFETYFFGKTYKHSYTLNFNRIGEIETEVNIYVKLQAVQVFSLLRREEKLERVENYLRQKLFDKISGRL